MDGEIKAIIGDIHKHKNELHRFHEGMIKHLKDIHHHLEKLMKKGTDAYVAKGFNRHTTDPHLNDDRVFLISFIRSLTNFYQDMRADNAHAKMEALSKASIEAHKRWADLFAGDYPEVTKVRHEGMEIFKGLVTIAHEEEVLEREEF